MTTCSLAEFPSALKKLQRTNYFDLSSQDKTRPEGLWPCQHLKQDSNGVKFHGHHSRPCMGKNWINKHALDWMRASLLSSPSLSHLAYPSTSIDIETGESKHIYKGFVCESGTLTAKGSLGTTCSQTLMSDRYNEKYIYPVPVDTVAKTASITKQLAKQHGGCLQCR